jgi:hypothetical protein
MQSGSPNGGSETVVLRPTSGIVLTVVTGVLAVLGLSSFVVRGDGLGVLRYGLLAVAVVYFAWLFFWYPRVTIDPSGVGVRNVLRTHHVTWPAITSVETKYALTIVTAHDKVVAWSAPAPSRYAAINNTGADVRGTYARENNRSVAVGDVPRSESGNAALHVRRAWVQLRDAGHLDSGAIEGPEIRRHWNARVIVLSATLVVLGFALTVLV